MGIQQSQINTDFLNFYVNRFNKNVLNFENLYNNYFANNVQ